MAWFLVDTHYRQDKFGEVRPRHRDYLRKLAEEGTLLVGGPLADETGGLLLFQAEDEAAVRKIMAADPYQTEGALENWTVREYKPVLGSWVP